MRREEERGGKEVNGKRVRLNKEYLITVIKIQDKCICSSLAITFIYLLDFGRVLARKGHVYWDPKYSYLGGIR